jgi:hypothetical protein
MKMSLRLTCLVVSAGMAIAACGGSDKASVATVTGATDTTVPQAATTNAPDATQAAAASTSEAASTAVPQSAPAAGANQQCPTDEAISSAAGVPMHFDNGDVQAAGFCPYKSDDENINVSVTFTPMNMTSFQDATQTEVPGLGQKALWADGSDELVVWLGNGSIIVSVLTFGQQGFDHLGFATKVAKTAIGQA